MSIKLAEFLVLKSGEQLTPDSIRVFQCDKASAQECSDFVSKQHPGGPCVIVLENIHSQGSKILQIMSRLHRTREYRRRLSIPDMHISPNGIYQGSQYGVQVCRWDSIFQENYNLAYEIEISLGEDVELLHGFLGRYLRSKMLNIEVKKLNMFQ